MRVILKPSKDLIYPTLTCQAFRRSRNACVEWQISGILSAEGACPSLRTHGDRASPIALSVPCSLY